MSIKPVVMITKHRTDADGRFREHTEVLDVDPGMTVQDLAEKVLALREPLSRGMEWGAEPAKDAPEPVQEWKHTPLSGVRLTIQVAHPLDGAAFL